jgi:hypothetical protein
MYITPVLTTTAVLTIFNQGDALDSFFGNWLSEQSIGDRKVEEAITFNLASTATRSTWWMRPRVKSSRLDLSRLSGVWLQSHPGNSDVVSDIDEPVWGLEQIKQRTPTPAERFDWWRGKVGLCRRIKDQPPQFPFPEIAKQEIPLKGQWVMGAFHSDDAGWRNRARIARWCEKYGDRVDEWWCVGDPFDLIPTVIPSCHN